MKRFREGLVCKAHRLVYHSTLGSRVIKKKKQKKKYLPQGLGVADYRGVSLIRNIPRP